MDNAADALIMAGSVLLFIIALSVVMVQFNSCKETIDYLIYKSDRDSKFLSTLDDETKEIYYENYYTYQNVGSNSAEEREVSLATVVESMYRAMYDNTRIQFEIDGLASDKWLTVYDTEKKEYYKTDAFQVSMINNLQPDTFSGLKYMRYLLTGDVPLSIRTTADDNFKRNITVNLTDSSSLYSILSRSNVTITQKFGIYTTGDVSINEANMKEVKVITYKITTN